MYHQKRLCKTLVSWCTEAISRSSGELDSSPVYHKRQLAVVPDCVGPGAGTVVEPADVVAVVVWVGHVVTVVPLTAPTLHSSYSLISPESVKAEVKSTNNRNLHKDCHIWRRGCSSYLFWSATELKKSRLWVIYLTQKLIQSDGEIQGNCVTVIS